MLCTCSMPLPRQNFKCGSSDNSPLTILKIHCKGHGIKSLQPKNLTYKPTKRKASLGKMAAIWRDHILLQSGQEQKDSSKIKFPSIPNGFANSLDRKLLQDRRPKPNSSKNCSLDSKKLLDKSRLRTLVNEPNNFEHKNSLRQNTKKSQQIPKSLSKNRVSFPPIEKGRSGGILIAKQEHIIGTRIQK